MIGCRGKRPTRGFLLLVFFALQKLTRKTTLSLFLLQHVTHRALSFTVRAEKPPQVDRTTGFIESDNTGMGNIFAVEPKQLYTESPTSDKYAKVGLGGIPGAILAVGILAGVFFGVQTLGSFEEVNNEFAGYDGESVSYYSEKFSS